jgi:hypothetical protein
MPERSILAGCRKAEPTLYESLGFERDRSSDWEFEPGEWLWGYRMRL